MCGLVGVLGVPFFKMSELFHNLLIVNQIRGPHSTGIAVVYPKGHTGYIKQIGDPAFLFCEKNYVQWIKNTSGVRPWVMMGHNRWATVGDKTAENAHPFQHGNIILAHNGTVQNLWSIRHNNTFYDTDSETICEAINRLGIDKVWSLLDGAAALTFYDGEQKTMNFIRNDQRPLYLKMINRGNNLVWASEKLMLDWIVSRTVNEIDCKEEAILLKTNHMVSFKYINDKLVMEQKDIVPFKRVVVRSSVNNCYHGWTGEDSEEMPINLPVKKETVNEDPIMLKERYLLQEYQDYIKHYKCSCTFCTEEMVEEDYENAIYLDKECFVCAKCSDVYERLRIK